MASYRVTWEVDIDAESHEAAALAAREMQLDPYSAATIFNVALERPPSRHAVIAPKYQPQTVDIAELE